MKTNYGDLQLAEYSLTSQKRNVQKIDIAFLFIQLLIMRDRNIVAIKGKTKIIGRVVKRLRKKRKSIRLLNWIYPNGLMA